MKLTRIWETYPDSKIHHSGKRTQALTLLVVRRRHSSYSVAITYRNKTLYALHPRLLLDHTDNFPPFLPLSKPLLLTQSSNGWPVFLGPHGKLWCINTHQMSHLDSAISIGRLTRFPEFQNLDRKGNLSQMSKLFRKSKYREKHNYQPF